MDALSEKELLNFAIESGIINLNTIQVQIEMNERKKYLEMHTQKIWKGTDGKWHTYLPEKGGRVHRKRNTKEEIEEVIIEYWREEEENPTITDVFNEWNDRRLELKKISPATHLRNKQCYMRHFNTFGERRIKCLSEDDITDFLEQQIPKFNLSYKSFSNLRGITRAFLKRAKKRKFINFSVDEAFDDMDLSDSEFKKTIKEDYEEVFDEEETPIVINYLIEHLDRWNIGILLMFVTGIRVGELVALKHSDFENNFFRVRRTESRFLKDGKYVYEVKEFPKSEAGWRNVVVPNDYMWLLGSIRSLNPFGEYIFVNDKGERMTTNCFRRRLERVCAKTNAYRKSPHKIRKTYGTILLDNKIDFNLATGQMGHTDIYTTEKHYHRNRKSIKTKADILSSIPDLQKTMSI